MLARQLGLALLASCFVAILSRRLRLPYSVGLVAAGIAIALFGGDSLRIDPHLIYTILLPPLIFEAALHLDWAPFLNALPVALTLAFPGVLLTAAIISAGMHLVLGWEWLSSVLLGILIAATDPVAVITAFKEMRVAADLRMLVEAESLLNDGSAAVGFALVIAVSNGLPLQLSNVAMTFGWMVFGGLATGAATGLLVILIAGRTVDHLVEITLTTIAAYGSFLTAEHLNMSGVLAALAAGLVVGNVGMLRSFTESGREAIISFWEYVTFLANSIIFLLIGGYEARAGSRLFVAAAAVAIGLVLLGRIATIYPFCGIFRRTRWRVDLKYQHVMVWGGLRGALALTLALSIPDSVSEKAGIVGATFAVVAFSVFVQSLTMPIFIRTLRLNAPCTA